MKLVIQDLDEEQLSWGKDTVVISKQEPIHNCIGCFGCWVKSPGQCVIQDGYQNIGEYFSKTEHLTIVSKCIYGGYSPFVKNILDRAISYIHPFFTIRAGKMHHQHRYSNHIPVTVYFYGEDITAHEKETAKRLVLANKINLDEAAVKVYFVKDVEALKEGLG